jgi:hypothetical protein
MKVMKCKLSTAPEIAIKARSRIPRKRKSRLAKANRIIAMAAMDRRKKVSEIAVAWLAKRMRIALDPKTNEAMKRAVIPFDGNNQGSSETFQDRR